MSNRLVSEDSVDRLNELIDQLKDKSGNIEIELENDCEEVMWKKYEELFRSVNSVIWQLEETAKYL